VLVFLKAAGERWLSSWKRRTCDHAECSRWLSVGHLKTRKVGVQLGSAWYCSYVCFYGAAEEQFTEILATRSRLSPAKTSMPLGLELVARGLITPEQLRTTSEQLQTEGGEVGELFVQNGYVTEAQVTAARATLSGCPVYNPPPGAVHATGILIPPALAASSHAIPMHYVGATKQLLLGFLRSVDYELMFALEKMTGCTAKACFIKPSDFQLHRAHTDQSAGATAESASEIIFNNTYTASERARILCNYGAQLNADQVQIRLCRNYLWARLHEGTETFDLLFKID
jgi:hypothetical protein